MEGIPPRILTICEAITEICSRAVTTIDREAVFQQICNTLVERAIYAAVSIGSVDKGGLKVKTIAQAGLLNFPMEFRSSDLPEMDHNSPYVCNNLSIANGENLLATEAGSRGFLSMAVFPVAIANNIAALFIAYSRSTDTFSTDELSMIEKLEKHHIHVESPFPQQE